MYIYLTTDTVCLANCFFNFPLAFATLVKEYVNCINRGAIPEISSTFQSLVEVECNRAIDEALTMYKMIMQTEIAEVGQPLDLSEIHKLHDRCFAEALKHFGDCCIGDAEGAYLKSLQVRPGKKPLKRIHCSNFFLLSICGQGPTRIA